MVEPPNHIRVVTISRQVGAGGREIGHAVARLLGYRFLDGEVIIRAAETAGVTPELIEDAEHYPPLRKRMLDALASPEGFAALSWMASSPYAASPIFTSEHYRAFAQEVIREIPKEGAAVILGHGGQVILRDRWDTIRVLITASDDHRLPRIKERNPQYDDEDARRHLERSDGERRTYFERIYGVEWLSPRLYDLCLNTDHWTVEQSAALIADAARSR